MSRAKVDTPGAEGGPWSFAVDAVVVEGRSYREVASAHRISENWGAKLVARYGRWS